MLTGPRVCALLLGRYGFDPRQAPLDMRGTHLSPAEFHKALEWDNTICTSSCRRDTIVVQFAVFPCADPPQLSCMLLLLLAAMLGWVMPVQYDSLP